MSTPQNKRFLIDHHSPSGEPVILITGMSGLIGRYVTQVLDPDYDVVGMDRNPPQSGHPIGDCWIQTDLTDDASVREGLALLRKQYGNRLASVIHLAAYYDFTGAPSDLYEKLTVQGTRRLLRGLQEFDCEQFVFSSSLLVMAPHEKHISELSPTRANWPYPESKLKAEAVIRQERGQIPTVVLRIAGVYNEDGNSLPLSQQISRIYEKDLESYVYPGDSSAGQALIHLDDLAECFRRVVERRRSLADEEMFLIGEEQAVPYGELQDLIGAELHGDEWPTIRIPKFVAKAGAYVLDKFASEENKPFIKPWMIDMADDNYEVNLSHARSQLDWSPRHSLRETLPEILRRLQANPRDWYQRHHLPITDDLPQASPQKR